MHAHIRLTALAMLLLIGVTSASAQPQPQEASRPTGSISGRVSVGGKAAPGVIVILTPSNSDPSRALTRMFGGTQSVRATTDPEGRYQMTGVAAGRYSITAFAPALIAPGDSDSPSTGKTINISEGEAVEKIDFALVRGGVITGRITRADGRPMVAETVTLTRADDPDKKTQDSAITNALMGETRFLTDDRGVYRIYGLAPGRYFVSVGQASGGVSGLNINMKRSYHTQTFHPGVTDRAKAAEVEVTAGGEVAGVDIRLGLPSQTYKVTGRVTNAETGRPVSAALANYGSTSAESKYVQARSLGSIANAKGEFRFDALVPGRYQAFASFDEGSDYYSDLTPFEVREGDVSGVEIKVHRGLTISGMVVIEGTGDPEVLASLSQLQLFAVTAEPEMTAPTFSPVKIGADGGFRITGLQPGKVRLQLNRFFVPTKLAVLRVERGGIAQRDGVQIAPGENISDVRVVLGYANGVVRGQIKTADGASLEDFLLSVTARRMGDDDKRNVEHADVDANGRFVIEGLLPGQYELTLEAFSTNPARDAGTPSPPVRQVISVTNEIESNVTLTFDAGAKKDN